MLTTVIHLNTLIKKHNIKDGKFIELCISQITKKGFQEKLIEFVESNEKFDINKISKNTFLFKEKNIQDKKIFQKLKNILKNIIANQEYNTNDYESILENAKNLDNTPITQEQKEELLQYICEKDFIEKYLTNKDEISEIKDLNSTLDKTII